MDCTASMEPWIQAAKSQIRSIVDGTKTQYPNAEIKIAFVGYRDIHDTERFIPFSFRTPSSLLHSIEHVHATGGHDECEDVAGGLVQARRLEWDDADVKCIVHIADAPPHGEWFHSPYISDQYPEGDPTGLDPVDSIHILSQQDFNYTFVKINNSTDRMLEYFKKAFSLLGSFKVLDLRPQTIDGRATDLLTPYLVQSLSDSITRHSASQDPEEGSCSPK